MITRMTTTAMTSVMTTIIKKKKEQVNKSLVLSQLGHEINITSIMMSIMINWNDSGSGTIQDSRATSKATAGREDTTERVLKGDLA